MLVIFIFLYQEKIGVYGTRIMRKVGPSPRGGDIKRGGGGGGGGGGGDGPKGLC